MKKLFLLVSVSSILFGQNSVLKQFSNQFADIAEKANPAVVTILTEKNIDLTELHLQIHLIKNLVFWADVLGMFMVKFGQIRMAYPYKKDIMLKVQAQEIYIKKVISGIRLVFMEIKISLDVIICLEMQIYELLAIKVLRE